MMLQNNRLGFARVLGIVVCMILNVLETGLAMAGERFSMKNPLHGEGMTVVDHTSPEFIAGVRKFMDADIESKSSSFLPYSIILINNTGKYVWGFTVVYSYPDKIAPAGTPWRYITSPSSRSTDRREMLEPGASMLITPISDVLGSLDAHGSKKLRMVWDEGLDRVLKVWDSDWSSGRIEVSVDSVIYEDGTLVGPDGSDRMGQLNARIRADSDLFASVYSLRGDELRKNLSLYPRSGGALHDEYSRRAAATAESLLNFLDDRGEAALVDALMEQKAKGWFGEFKLVKRGKHE